MADPNQIDSKVRTAYYAAICRHVENIHLFAAVAGVDLKQPPFETDPPRDNSCKGHLEQIPRVNEGCSEKFFKWVAEMLPPEQLGNRIDRLKEMIDEHENKVLLSEDKKAIIALRDAMGDSANADSSVWWLEPKTIKEMDELIKRVKVIKAKMERSK